MRTEVLYSLTQVCRVLCYESLCNYVGHCGRSQQFIIACLCGCNRTGYTAFYSYGLLTINTPPPPPPPPLYTLSMIRRLMRSQHQHQVGVNEWSCYHVSTTIAVCLTSLPPPPHHTPFFSLRFVCCVGWDLEAILLQSDRVSWAGSSPFHMCVY